MSFCKEFISAWTLNVNNKNTIIISSHTTLIYAIEYTRTVDQLTS